MLVYDDSPRQIYRGFLIALAVLALGLLACSAVRGSEPARYRWEDQGERVVLRRGLVEVGAWFRSENAYRPTLGPGSYGLPCPPPLAVGHDEPDPGPMPGAEPVFGVVAEKIPDAPAYSISGRPCTRAQARAAVTKGIPEDRDRLRLTLIGSEAECAAVLADPGMAEARGRYLVQDYRPTEWPVGPGTGFVTTGHPTIYLQDPPDEKGFGKVRLRLDGYDPQTTPGMVRRADPTYRPADDPDGKAAPGLPLGDIPPWGWAAGAAAAFMVFSNKNGAK